MASTELLGGSGFLSLFVVLFSICFILRILDRYIQEGGFTSAFGLTTIHFVPISPRNFRLLTEEGRDAYCKDLSDDWSGDADTGKYTNVFSWSEVASVFTDMPYIPLMTTLFFLFRHNGDFNLRSLKQILMKLFSDSSTGLPICTCFLLNLAHELT